jgi:hypothetical protein
VRAAADGLPGSLEVPDGAVKQEMILAWLWRYLHPSDNSKMTEARRLVYVLPQGAIVEPAGGRVREWLARLGLAAEVGLHVSMGMWSTTEGPDWREEMHRPAIVIGTAEFLVSKALMRAFGVGSTLWPIDFALVTNGARWIVHEERLSRQAVVTLRVIEAAAQRWGTAERFGLTVLSCSCAGERVRAVPWLRGIERAALAASPGELLTVSSAAPPAAGTPQPAEPPVLGMRELLALFDTDGVACDEASPFCVEGDPQVGVAWATWTPGEDGAPAPEVRLPAGEWRCAVPLSAAGELARSRAVWRWDPDGRWKRVCDVAEVRPYSVLLVSASDGGYDTVRGLDPAAREPVAGCPVLRTPEEMTASQAAEVPAAVPRRWKTLDVHSQEVRDQAAALLAVLRPAVPAAAASSAIAGGYLHDAGKAHQTWQDALCALAPAGDQAIVAAGRPWAKSGHGADGRLEFAGGVTFLHELASLLIIDSPLRGLLSAAPDADLCRYLVLAHHGRLRMRVLEPEAPRAWSSGCLMGP